jgi:hypothetical protein
VPWVGCHLQSPANPRAISLYILRTLNPSQHHLNQTTQNIRTNSHQDPETRIFDVPTFSKSCMDLLRYRQQVARGLNAVEASLALLVNALAHSAVSIEAEPTADEESPIRRVCEAYSTINYRMDDEVGLSVVCLGVIGANAEILRLAEAVNRAKANFIAVCAPLQDIFTRIPVKDETSPTRSVPLIRVILRNLQRSDLNLLAAYRNIPILGAPPASVTYTRANTRAVYRKSLEEIDELLQNREGPAATADRQRLETLDRRETHLALVKARYRTSGPMCSCTSRYAGSRPNPNFRGVALAVRQEPSRCVPGSSISSKRGPSESVARATTKT